LPKEEASIKSSLSKKTYHRGTVLQHLSPTMRGTVLQHLSPTMLDIKQTQKYTETYR